mmetsp:Transcript_11733/g.32999  ORF Transcript_11733/g.32999 Transcript_11733/m.32999 type:complete len:494 (-) Transcript_11733:302-1783(-)
MATLRDTAFALAQDTHLSEVARVAERDPLHRVRSTADLQDAGLHRGSVLPVDSVVRERPAVAHPLLRLARRVGVPLLQDLGPDELFAERLLGQVLRHVNLLLPVHGDQVGGVLIDSDAVVRAAGPVQGLHILSHPRHEHVLDGAVVAIRGLYHAVHHVGEVVVLEVSPEVLQIPRAARQQGGLLGGLRRVAKNGPVRLVLGIAHCQDGRLALVRIDKGVGRNLLRHGLLQTRALALLLLLGVQLRGPPQVLLGLLAHPGEGELVDEKLLADLLPAERLELAGELQMGFDGFVQGDPVGGAVRLGDGLHFDAHPGDQHPLGLRVVPLVLQLQPEQVVRHRLVHKARLNLPVPPGAASHHRNSARRVLWAVPELNVAQLASLAYAELVHQLVLLEDRESLHFTPAGLFLLGGVRLVALTVRDVVGTQDLFVYLLQRQVRPRQHLHLSVQFLYDILDGIIKHNTVLAAARLEPRGSVGTHPTHEDILEGTIISLPP